MEKIKITPIAGSQNRLVVLPTPPEEVTASGIIIPEVAKEKPQKGTVISISEIDEKGNRPIVKVGDVVLYGKYAGTEVSLEDVSYLIMRESDVFAII